MTERIAMIGGLLAALAMGGTALADAISARAWNGAPRGRALLPALAAAAFGAAIVVRWMRAGHGPFLSLYEILLSNAFSLALALAIAATFDVRVRGALSSGAAVLVLIAAWLTLTSPADTVLPPTYATPVLWLHVAASKLFLGLTLIAVSLACERPLRRSIGRDGAPAEDAAWSYAGAALAAQTLLLVAGAWWAQDAWGRYWDWDPLEAWAFVTWAAAGAAMHLSRRWPTERTAWLIVPVFVLAFWTFFGIPFLSTAPHKGAI